jgi:hypothetical protein
VTLAGRLTKSNMGLKIHFNLAEIPGVLSPGITGIETRLKKPNSLYERKVYMTDYQWLGLVALLALVGLYGEQIVRNFLGKDKK